jgi:hypothetical protein
MQNFLIYYPDVCLQLNVFRVFSRPSSGAQCLQWQPLVLPSYRCDMEFMGRKLKEEYEKWGFTMNLEKTKYIYL